MKLNNLQKQILEMLMKEAHKGIAGYANLTKTLTPQNTIEEVRNALLELEDNGLVRYMRTQDRSLNLAQITNQGMDLLLPEKYKKHKKMLEQIGSWVRGIKGKNIVAALAIALILVVGGSYFQGATFQANLFGVQHTEPENAILDYTEIELGDDAQITYAGQLSTNYFYQVDTAEGHWLFTLSRSGEIWRVEEVETLHR